MSINFPLELHKVQNFLYCTGPLFSSEECNFLIQKALQQGFNKSKIISLTGEDEEDLDSRNCDICFLNVSGDMRPFNEKFTAIIKDLNQKFFNYDIDHVELLQVSRYRPGEKYDWHFDSVVEGPWYRKLSISIQLSDEDDYEGGELKFRIPQEVTTPKTRGCVTIFPSYIMHTASEVTKGERYSLVSWICGPPFK